MIPLFSFMIPIQTAKGASGTLSGAWGNYLRQFEYEGANLQATEWLADNSYWLNRAGNNPIGYTSRLMFKFYEADGTYATISVLNYTKFSQVLTYFDGEGLQVIPDCHQNDDTCLLSNIETYWETFATYYKDDDRIAAFNLFNEPTGYYQTVINYYAQVADSIWAIDSDRYILFPRIFGCSGWNNATDIINAIKATGIQNNPYCLFDVDHPYFFENSWDMGLNPTQKASWYLTNRIQPFIDEFGASRCWIGETFYWNGKTPSLQAEWLEAIVNVAITNLVDIQAIKLWGSSSTVQAENDALQGYTPIPTNYWQGFASFPRTVGGSYTTSVIDDVIDAMDEYGLNIYRMSCPQSWSASQAITFAEYFLEHCNYELILDYDHDYPPGTTTPSRWTIKLNDALTILGSLSDYQDRLWIEPVNERYDSDFRSRIQTIVTAIRNAGYTAKIVADVHTSYQYSSILADMANINDPLDKFYTGQHFYFNQWTLSQAESFMQVGLNAGLKMVNTEVSADSNEYGSFSQSEVDDTTEFVAWCYSHGISNAVWQCYGLMNWPTYLYYDFTFPYFIPSYPYTSATSTVQSTITSTVTSTITTTTPTTTITSSSVTTTSATSVYIINPTWVIGPNWNVGSEWLSTLTVQSSSGGIVSPSIGTYEILNGQNQSLSATPNPGFHFVTWEIDGEIVTGSTRNWYVVMDGVDHTVKVYFAPGQTTTQTSTTTYSSTTVTYTSTVSTTGTTTSSGGGTSTYQTTYTTSSTITSSSTSILIMPGEYNSTFYFRNDGRDTNDFTGYSLDLTNTDSPLYFTDDASTGEMVYYSFDVNLIRYGGEQVELGSKVAIIQSQNVSVTYKLGLWNCPERKLLIGYDAFQVIVYSKVNDTGTWSAKAIFVTPQIISTKLYFQTWYFYMHVNRTATNATLSWGSSNYNSRIEGIGLKVPTDNELGTWRWDQGNIIGFILGSYVDRIGPVAYLLILLIPSITLYVRHRNTNVVVFMFILFGGSGGIVWLLVPIWAAAVIDALLVLGYAFLVFKVIR